MQQTIPVNDRTIASHVGSTPSTGPFTVDFPFFSLDDVVVTVLADGASEDLAVRLVRGADYDLAGVATEDGSFSGGTITLVLPISNTTLTRTGDTSIQRTSNFPLQGFFSRLALNAELNRITTVLQEFERESTVLAQQIADHQLQIEELYLLIQDLSDGGGDSMMGDVWYSTGNVTDPVAPAAGVAMYFVDGEPRVRPSSAVNGGRVRRGQFRYWGNLTVSPSDPWREIIENYGGGGTITLANGVYDLGGVAMTIANGAHMTIAGSFPLGATVRGGLINITGGNTTLTNILFEAPATGGGMFVLRGGFTWMIDCDVDGTLSTADSVFQLVGAQLNLRASLRDSVFTIGTGVRQQMLDVDTGSAIKIVGSMSTQDSTGFWVKCVFAPDVPRGKSFLVLDTSHASVSSLWVLGIPGLPGTFTVTAVDTTADTLTYTPATVLDDNTAISFTSTGTLPAPLVVDTIYFAKDSAGGVMQVAAEPDGPAIDLSTAGSGTITIVYGAVGTGIVVRRLSTCSFLGANTFEMLAQGIVVSNGSLFINKDTRFKACRLPLRGEYNFSMVGPSEAELSDPLSPNGPQFFRDLTPTRTFDVVATGSACTAAGTVLTVSGTVTGTWAVGQTVIPITGSVITSLGTGSGGAGTYNLNIAASKPVPIAMSGIVYRPIGYDSYTQEARLVYSPNTPTTVVMTQNDKELVVSKSAAITTVELPADMPFGYTCRVSDGEGNAAAFNTTITAAAGSGGTINGAASVLLNTAFQSRLLRCLGDNIWTTI